MFSYQKNEINKILNEESTRNSKDIYWTRKQALFQWLKTKTEKNKDELDLQRIKQNKKIIWSPKQKLNKERREMIPQEEVIRICYTSDKKISVGIIYNRDIEEK